MFKLILYLITKEKNHTWEELELMMVWQILEGSTNEKIFMYCTMIFSLIFFLWFFLFFFEELLSNRVGLSIKELKVYSDSSWKTRVLFVIPLMMFFCSLISLFSYSCLLMGATLEFYNGLFVLFWLFLFMNGFNRMVFFKFFCWSQPSNCLKLETSWWCKVFNIVYLFAIFFSLYIYIYDFKIYIYFIVYFYIFMMMYWEKGLKIYYLPSKYNVYGVMCSRMCYVLAGMYLGNFVYLFYLSSLVSYLDIMNVYNFTKMSCLLLMMCIALEFWLLMLICSFYKQMKKVVVAEKLSLCYSLCINMGVILGSFGCLFYYLCFWLPLEFCLLILMVFIFIELYFFFVYDFFQWLTEKHFFFYYWTLEGYTDVVTALVVSFVLVISLCFII